MAVPAMAVLAAFLLPPRAHAARLQAPNTLGRWVAAYRAGAQAYKDDGFTANWRAEIDSQLAEWDKDPKTFPLTPVGNHFTDAAVSEAGQACNDPQASDPDPLKAFQKTVECLYHAVHLYRADNAARQLVLEPSLSANASVPDDGAMTADSISKAVAAYKSIDGQGVNMNDPGGDPGHSLWDRVVETGNGQFAPGAQIALRQDVDPDLFRDRGRQLVGAKDCSAKMTLAELYYEALRASNGSVTVAAGAISGMLHDERHLADCILGLRRNDYKDYYRFAGLYIGLQKNAVRREAASVTAQVQTASYGALRTLGGYVHVGANGPLNGAQYADYDAKFPELYTGLNAASVVREHGL